MKQKLLLTCSVLCFIFPVYLCTWLGAGLTVTVSRMIAEYRESDEVRVSPADVEIFGNDRVSRETLLIQAGLDRPRSYFDIDADTVGFYIGANGWVRKCMVKKIFPDTVKILIKEHEPAIIVTRFTEKEQGHSVDPWFADKRGILFKKAYSQEINDSLPMFHAAEDDGNNGKHIRTAVRLSEEWYRAEAEFGDICTLRSIDHSITEGYGVSCDLGRGRNARIAAGQLENPDTVKTFVHRFFTTAWKLDRNGLRAGSFIFESRDRGKIIVGNLSRKQ